MARIMGAVAAGEVLPAPDFLRVLVPMLVNGTKEKNSAVKSSSETALVAVMAMRHGGEGQKKCLAVRLEMPLDQLIGFFISYSCFYKDKDSYGCIVEMFRNENMFE